MSVATPEIEIRTSPHVRTTRGVETIMLHVVFALLPAAAFAVYSFGASALALIASCMAASMLTEYVICRSAGRETTLSDYSAVITGLLLALTLPPGFPLWMGAVGGAISIAVGKMLFGGIGYNVFNPALVGRAFLQAAFPVAITTWTPPQPTDRFLEFIPSSLAIPFLTAPDTGEWLSARSVDGFSGATPLALMKFDGQATEAWSLFTGLTAGSAGETSSILILIGGAYLIARNMMDWRIPVAMLGTAAVVSGVFYVLDGARYPDPIFTLLSGGLMLGALFMATDMVSSPVTPLGVWVYGAMMGLLTVIIRLFGGLPEGVMYAILLGNAATPLIDELTQPRVYGTGRNAGDTS